MAATPPNMQTHVMARLPLYPVLFCRYCNNSSSQKYHLIGPPDPESNLVILKLRPPRNEAEKKLQKLQLEVNRFNNNFWKKHNQEFKKLKTEYIEKILAETNSPQQKLTVDQLSDFYKQFLDEKYSIHKIYLKQWFVYNILLTWAMLAYRFTSIFHVMKRKNRYDDFNIKRQ